MPSSVFKISQIWLLSDSVVRVLFSRKPLVGSGTAAQRCDNNANWTLTSPSGTASILVASAVSSDEDFIDLHLSAPLGNDTWTATVAATVLSADLSAITQNVGVFEVTESEDIGLGLGATEDTDIEEFKRWINPAFRNKPGWQGLIKALASGFGSVKDFGTKSFDQLFLASASGKYLKNRAASYAIDEPEGTGIGDEDFRDLSLSIINEKIVQNAFLEKLSIIYGDPVVKAYAETGLTEPFEIDSEQTLDICIDESHDIKVTFKASDFEVIRRAKAQEIANFLNSSFISASIPAYATTYQSPETGLNSVRVFSKKTLGSSVRITGGTSQTFLRFGDRRVVEPSPLPVLPTWTITKTGNTVRLAPSTDTVYNFGTVEVGDYLVINGTEFNSNNRGSFAITAVDFSYNTGTGAVAQWIEIENKDGVAESVAQSEIFAVDIFYPRKFVITDNPIYSLIYETDGDAYVRLPTTTKIVSRNASNGAYLNQATSLDSTLVRSEDSATITTSSAHGLSVGNRVILDGFSHQDYPVSETAAVAQSGVNFGTTKTSPISSWTNSALSHRFNSDCIRDSQKRLWFFGGEIFTPANPSPITELVDSYRYEIGTETTKPYSSTYRVISGTSGTMSFGAATQELTAGANAGEILRAGGWETTPWTVGGGALWTSNSRAISMRTFHETALHQDQLDTFSFGFLSAVAFYGVSNPVSGDSISIRKNGTTRTYGFGVGGDVTVTIGGDVATTLQNLVAAINGDGSATTFARYTTSLTEINSSLVVIIENQIHSSKSDLRIWGSFTSAGDFTSVVFGGDGYVQPDYSEQYQIATAIPSSDPGYGTGGKNIATGTLIVQGVYLSRNDDLGYLWNGATFTTAFTYILQTSLASLNVDRADGAMASDLYSGGYTLQNLATSDVELYNQVGDSWGVVTSLKEARAQHKAIAIGAEVLVTGGHQPAVNNWRTENFVTSWSFEGSLAGPTTLAATANPAVYGKVGEGIRVDAPMPGAGGASQTTLNTNLLGDYSLFGWMSSKEGVVLKNRGDVPWVDSTDNMLVSFGVNSSDQFFIRYQHSAGTIVNLTTTQTRASLMPIAHHQQGPRYYFWCITKDSTTSPGTTYWKLYVEGSLIQSWTDTSPDGGSGGLWYFGSADEGDIAYTGSIDEIGFLTSVIDADDVQRIYREEVGVAYPWVADLDSMPIGRALNSCEILDSSGFNRHTGPMTMARFDHSLCRLPDGRILACGGFGHSPSVQQPTLLTHVEAELKSAEIYDPDLGYWSPISDMNYPHSNHICEVIGDKVYVSGGFNSAKTEYLDLNRMEWKVQKSELDEVVALSCGGLAGDRTLVSWGGVTQTAPVDSFYQMVVGAEKIRKGRLDGEFKVESVPSSTTFTVDSTTITTGGSGTVIPVKAPAKVNGAAYTFDKFGVAITSISTTNTSEIKVGTYQDIDVVDASNFNESGWLIANFGKSNQVGPFRYISKVDDTTLRLDGNFVFNKSIPIGSEITMLSSKAGWYPTGHDGIFYLTNSNAGLIAAQQILKDISATGIDLFFDIIYPGDKGLGNSLDSENPDKTPDKVNIWGQYET